MTTIALLTTSFSDSGSGREAAGSFVEDVALALSRQVDIHVIAPAAGHSLTTRERLTIHRFAVPRLPLSLLKPRHPAHWKAIIQTVRSGQNAVSALVRDDAVDHMLALWALPSGWWARNAWLRTGIPYSTWALGSDIWTTGRIPLLRSLLRSVLRDSRNRFADGRLLADEVGKISGMDCSFLPSARNCPAAEKKRLADRPPYRLAFLGRWHPNKGIDLLFDALDGLTNEDWQRILEIRICGGGPLHNLVHERAARLTAAGRPVNIEGYLHRAKAAALLQRADYLMLPSRIDSIPVVFSDAMKSLTPVICTPVGDFPRLLSEAPVGIMAAGIGGGPFTDAIHLALQTPPRTFAGGLPRLAVNFDVNRIAEEILRRCLGSPFTHKA